MRAITNMRRRTSATSPGLPLGTSSLKITTLPNSALYNCLYLLRHISQQVKPSRGFGVDGPEEAYSMLQKYLTMQAQSRYRGDDSGGNCPQEKREYFIAVLDIEKCFDSVDTARLYDLLVHLLEVNSHW
jgi:hypothetical protein